MGGRLALGTAALAVPYGAPGATRMAPARHVAAATIEAALDAGVSLIDTAPGYGDAEALVGAVVDGAEVAIATKVGPDDDVRASVERSLAALRRDHLDLVQIHNADAGTLAGPMPGALAELRDEGLIGAAGATVYGEAAALAALAHPDLDAVQIAYSALDRRAERAVLPVAAERGRWVLARSVLLRGVLTPAGRALPAAFGPLVTAADAFRRAAGVDWDGLPGAAVAFARGRPEIRHVLLGPRDADELDDLLAGAGTVLDRERIPHPDLPEDLLDPSRWP